MKICKRVLCLLLIGVLNVSLLSGCEFLEIFNKYSAQITVIWEEDESVVFDEIIKIAKDKENSVQIPCRPKGFYKLIVNEIKNGEVQRENTFRYPAHVSFETSAKVIDQEITIKFVDERKTPTLVLDPNGAVEYKDNLTYVYKYDKELHFVKPLYCEYEGEKIFFSKYEIDGLSDISEYFGGVVAVGFYAVIIRIDSEYYVEKQNYIKYKSIELEIYIEIVK